MLRATEPLYDLLSRAATMIPGRTPAEQLFALYAAAAFDLARVGDLVEIGAWCGRSTVALGLAAQATGCRLHTVDIFPERDDWQCSADGSWSIKTVIDGETVEALSDATCWR